METADSWEDLNLNEYETNAKERLYDLCQQYLEAYNHLTDMGEYNE